MNTASAILIGLGTLGLLVSLTACESAKSGAEISAIGESLVSTTPAPTETTTVQILPIDRYPRAAMTYTNAVNACVAESRTLCTRDQYELHTRTGLVAYSFGHPGDYWITKEWFTNHADYGNRNSIIYDATYPPLLRMMSETNPRKFYCCH